VKCSILCETKTFFNHICFTNTLFITEQKMVLAFILSSVSVSRNIALRRIYVFFLFFLLQSTFYIIYKLHLEDFYQRKMSLTSVLYVYVCTYTATDFIQTVPLVYEMQFYMLQFEKVLF